jgi:preprotein translocase subunit SecF
MNEKLKTKIASFHDKHYKILLVIPAIILVISLIYIFIFYSNNGDFIYKDVSLSGGTSVTIYGSLDANALQQALSEKLEDISTREIYDRITGEQKAVIVDTKTNDVEAKQILEQYLGYQLTEDNSSIEFTGSSLSSGFYQQLLVAILVAFVFMAIVVFLIFRTFVPSLAVIISAFADIFMTLTMADVLGIKMSSAGIVALLMLIGYSVDTDILLTNRVLKRSGSSLNSRLYGAFMTGITMTLTSIFAIGAALLVVSSFSVVLSQIFTILLIGLSFDLLNTWITNVSIIKWYALKKGK